MSYVAKASIIMCSFKGQAMEQHFRHIIEGIGEILAERLVKTPQRAARAFEFMMQGYQKKCERYC